MGRPVILPRSNVGRFVQHGEDAWVLDKVDALGIVESVLQLRENTALADRLAQCAVAFAQKHFDWKKNTSELVAFYDKVANQPKGVYVAAGADS
jgi:glycosyltransferase involved in cell wall biosynthesis